MKERKKQVYIFLTPKDLSINFNFQDEVILKFIQNYSEFIYKGLIIRKMNSFFNKGIVFKILDIKEYQNCRLLRRFNVRLKISVKTSLNTLIPANVVDISLGGLQFYSKTELDDKQDLSFIINLSSNNSIEFVGKIVHKTHKKNISKYGVKIININEENNQKLTNYIDLLTKEHEKLLKSLKYFQIARIIGIIVGIIIMLVLMTVEL